MTELNSICLQVAEAMKWLHANNCVHRDLAARNILLKKNRCGNIRAKIGDFGLSQYADRGYISDDERFAFRWSAPEVIFRRLYTKKSDVWSFAIVMWELYTCGYTPYYGLDKAQVEDMLRYNERLNFPEASCDEVVNLMASCWRRRPSDRPTFKQIVTRLKDAFYGGD